MKTMNIIEKYLDTKQKKIVAGVIAGALIIGCAGAVILNKSSNDLVLTSNTLDVELGQTVSTNIDDYLDHDKVNDKLAKKIIKETEEKDDLKYVKVVNKDENGNVVSKEEKDYPKVGNYEINFTYGKEKATVKVTVKDTTKPEIKAPESIDIIQYTDLSTFNFSDLLEATDYSDVKDWKIDTSKVDVNTIGSYDLKVSIQDRYKNKASKKLKVNVVEAPAVDDGEVAVTEVITDENGNKKTVVTKKTNSEVSSNDAVASSSPVSNKGTVKSDATNTKPASNSGTSTPASSSSSNSSSNSNTNTSNNGGNSSNNTSKPSAHTHNYNIPITKTVHHDAETKTVHHDAVVENQPVYETHILCGNYAHTSGCQRDFGMGEAAVEAWGVHSDETGHYNYHNCKVQVGTKQEVIKEAYDETVVVKQAYDETVTTGYRCSCGAVK